MFPPDMLHALGQSATGPAFAPLWKIISQLPEDRLALLMRLYASIPSSATQQSVTGGFLKNIGANPEFFEWLRRITTHLSERPLEKFFQNFIVNSVIEGTRRRLQLVEEHGFMGPYTIVINPTMKCNLRCVGCYAYNFDKCAHMDYDLLRKVLSEARDMGTRFITVSGGEPFVYPHFDRMAEEFSDLIFMCYTNSTVLDEQRVARLAELGNVWPAISVEGYEAETTRRRGPGVWEKIQRAMRLLREAGVMFGFSATPTRLNSDLMAEDRFIDFYIEQGALFGWMFQYIPVGLDPDLNLMATAQQREQLRRATKRWQTTRPIFVGDFWNDGACVGGCLSASKYCYVTPDGQVQPCTFVHFYTHNAREHTLVDIFKSPLFRCIREHQPYDRNLLRPCKIIDNPAELRAIVEQTGARPTYEGADAIIRDPKIREHLDRYAAEWQHYADAAWKSDEYHEGRQVVVPFLGRVNVYDIWPARMRGAEERATARTAAEACARPVPAAKTAVVSK
jgi:MoaA/NifB/PqqE/SkfB family radical SAM enzyme